jgi:hypothetical protein
MRKLLTFLVLLTVTAVVQAQDVIVKKDGNTILSKILEIGTKEIKYKKFNNQSGPTYTIEKENVSRINFENGTTETFDETDAVEDKSIEAQLQKLSQADDKLVNALNYKRNNVYEKRAIRYRKLSWIGGVFIAAGAYFLLDPEFAEHSESGNRNSYMLGGILVASGVVWATSYGIASSIQHKKAKPSSSIGYLFEMNFPNSKFSANVNVMKTPELTDTALGVGLKYNF